MKLLSCIKKPARTNEQVFSKLLNLTIETYEAISIRFNRFLFKVCFIKILPILKNINLK